MRAYSDGTFNNADKDKVTADRAWLAGSGVLLMANPNMSRTQLSIGSARLSSNE